MIILQAEFIGDNSYGSIPFSKSCIYNLRFEVRGSAFSIDNHHWQNLHIGSINIQTTLGEFPHYSRDQFDYDGIESFFEQWKIVKINHFNPDLPKYDSQKVKSLLFENMRQYKLDKLI